MLNLLWALAGIFIVIWVLGLSFHVVGGGLIHLLLVLAVLSVIVRLVAGRRAV